MRGEGEEGQAVEHHAVDEAVCQVLGGQQHDEHHHELCVEHQHPGDDRAHDAAGVPDEPHGGGRGGGDDVLGDGDTLLGLQVAGPGLLTGLRSAMVPPAMLPAAVLRVPASVHRALHASFIHAGR